MATPLWFCLIERWVPDGMGTTGVTLPFLAGALARAEGRKSVSSDDLHFLLRRMVEEPVPGFTVEVQYCPNVRNLVLSVAQVDQALPFNGCHLPGPSGAPAIGFSQNAQSLFGGLDSSDPEECAARLHARALSPCISGTFSRLRNEESGDFEFEAFSEKELEYIERHSHLPDQQT